MAVNYDLNNTGQEVQERLDQVMPNKSDIEQEVLDRQSGDNALQEQIDAINTEIGESGQGGETINGRLDELESAVGSGGSVDERIADAKTEIVGGASEDYDTLGKVEGELVNTYRKDETYSKEQLDSLITTPDVEYVTVIAVSTTTDVTTLLPNPGAANTIYRVGNWNGTQYDPTVYSLYAWNGSAYILLAVRTSVGEVYDISVNHPDGQGNPAVYTDLANALGTNGINVPADIRRGGMSVKFIKAIPAKYSVVVTETTTQPTGTALSSASSVTSGTYEAEALTDFSTLPSATGSANAVVYYYDNSGTFTVWTITMTSAQGREYKQCLLMATDFSINASDWQGVDAEPTAGSRNLVESGGVKQSISAFVNIDLSLLTKYNYYIVSSGKWNYASTKHIVVPVVAGDIYYIKANNTYSCHYAFLTDNSYSVGTMAPFVNGTGRMVINTNESVYAKIPDTCNFLYFAVSIYTNESVEDGHLPEEVAELVGFKEVYNDIVFKDSAYVESIKAYADGKDAILKTELKGSISEVEAKANEALSEIGAFIPIFEDETSTYRISSSGDVKYNSGFWMKVIPLSKDDIIITNCSGASNTAALSFAETNDAAEVTVMVCHTGSRHYFSFRASQNGYAYICYTRDTDASFKIIGAGQPAEDAIGLSRIESGKNVIDELVGSSFSDTTLWSGGYYNSDGVVTGGASTGYYHCDKYFPVVPGTYIQRFQFSSSARCCIYDKDKELIGTFSSGNVLISREVTIPSNGAFIRVCSNSLSVNPSFISQQDSDYEWLKGEEIDQRLDAIEDELNQVFVVDNNLIDQQSLLELNKWTITAEDGTVSADNYGKDNVRYLYELPVGTKKLHVRFDFQLTRYLARGGNNDDQRICTINGSSSYYMAGFRQPSFDYNSGSGYIGRAQNFTIRSGSNVIYTNLNYVQNNGLEGDIAFTLMFNGDASDPSNADLQWKINTDSIQLVHSTDNSVAESITVSDTDRLDELIDTINASTLMSATPYRVTLKTWADAERGLVTPFPAVTSNGTPTVLPAKLLLDERWHTFEAVLDFEELTSYSSLDGLTIPYNITIPEGSLYIGIGGTAAVSNYTNTPIRVRNLHIDINSFGDAEVIHLLNYDGESYTRQLISNANPRVIVFEGHMIDVRMDKDTLSNEMAVSTDRLRTVFAYAKSKGYVPISWQQLKDWKINNVPLPSKRCYTLMFDDFRIENYMVLDAKKPFVEFGVKPGLAIITDYNGIPRSRSEEVTIDGNTWTLGECFDAIIRGEWYPTSHTFNHTVMNSANVPAYQTLSFVKHCIQSCQKLGIYDDIIVYPQGTISSGILRLLPISGLSLGVNIQVEANYYICRGRNDFNLYRIEIGHGNIERTEKILKMIEDDTL